MASDAGNAALGGKNQGRRMGLDFVRRKKDGEAGKVGGLGKTKGGSKGGRGFDAAASLMAAEERASTEVASAEDSLDGARENEAGANGFYSGDGKKEKAKGRGKGFLKKKGPMGLIIGLIFGVGGIMGVSQLSQPFSLIENLRETFNSMQTSVDRRSNKFFKMQMDAGNVKNPIKEGLFFSADKFKISKKQRSKLSQQGIEVVDLEVDGKKYTVLEFDDGTGQKRVITADNKVTNALSTDSAKARLTELGLNPEPMSFQRAYYENSDFYYGYNKGSKTWRGAISGWFDSVTVKFLQSNKLTRNLFKNFQEEVAKAGDGNTKKVALDLIEQKATGADAEGGLEEKKNQTETETDEDGNTTEKPATEDVDTDGDGQPDSTKYAYDTDTDTSFSNTKKMTDAQARKILGDFKSKYGGTSGVLSGATQTVCTIFNVMGSIGMLVMANEVLQIINLTTAYFEAVDKAKAGQGDASPINELMGTLNEVKTVEYAGFESNGGESVNLGSESSIEGAFTQTKKDGTGSAMESSGIASIYGGGKVDPNDDSVKSFNVLGSLNTIIKGLGLSSASFTGCTIAKMTAAAGDAAIDAAATYTCVAGLIGAAFSFGLSLSACAPKLVEIVGSAAISAAVGALVGGVISVITPWFAQTMTRNLIADIGGEDLGNALTSGANMYMGNTHRANGGSLGNSEAYAAFRVEQEEVIANNAKYERMDKSPFDVTSRYTFLGTLVDSLMAFSTSNSLVSTISSGISTISSAVTSLMPTSTAIDIADDLYTDEEYEQMCPYLASIGAVGDAYCNPYIITDMSTMESDPVDVINDLNSNFEDELVNDNVVIKSDSDLARYIVYCDNRTSAFGIADQNIAGTVANFANVNTGNSFFDNAANGAIGAIPLIGDGIDVLQNKQQLEWSGYVTGESCVVGNDVGGKAPDWDEAKQYQRFIEDQSLAETMGLIEESAVTAYLDDYYEKNPLDQSYEGILARYSGLEKEDVVALLDIIEYGNYIANYDSSTRYAFAQELEIEDDGIMFEENRFEQVLGMPVYAIVYSDLRNKNFVA